MCSRNAFMLYTLQKIITVTIKPTKKSETNRFDVAFTTFSSIFLRCLESKIRAVIADRPIFRKRFELILFRKERTWWKGRKKQKKKSEEDSSAYNYTFHYYIRLIKHAIFSIFVLRSKSQRTSGFIITYQQCFYRERS